MDKKTSDELYGQILKSANRIKAEIMAENEDLIAFGEEISEEARRELRNVARITGTVFQSLMLNGYELTPVAGKPEWVKVTLGIGEFTCNRRAIEASIGAASAKKDKEKKKADPVPADAQTAPLFHVPSVAVPVKEEKPVSPEAIIPKEASLQDQAIREPVKEDAAEKENNPLPEKREVASLSPVSPAHEEVKQDWEQDSPWSQYAPKGEGEPKEGTDESLTEDPAEGETVKSPDPSLTAPDPIDLSKWDPEDFQDEHRKHEDMFTFDYYRINVSHNTSMNGEDMGVYIAPLKDYERQEEFSVPILVSIFYKGKMSTKSTFDMEAGRTMVQISIGDFYFLCRGSYDQNGVFQTTIQTTGPSAMVGDVMSIVSREKAGNPYNTGATHLRFHYVLDSDEEEIGSIHVFPIELGASEFIVMNNTNTYTDYYYVNRDDKTGSGREDVTIYADNEKKELLLNWNGKYLEADLMEV